jgi:hypothetical protein
MPPIAEVGRTDSAGLRYGLVTTATKTGTAENCTFGDLRRTRRLTGSKLWAYVVRQRSESMMDEMTIRVAIRTTARISFVLFLGAFLGNALYAVVPTAATHWLKPPQSGLVQVG